MQTIAIVLIVTGFPTLILMSAALAHHHAAIYKAIDKGMFYLMAALFGLSLLISEENEEDYDG